MAFNPIAGGSTVPTSAFVDPQTGRLVFQAIKWCQDLQNRVQSAIDELGLIQGQLSANVTIEGRAGTITAALQNINSTGILAAAAISGTIASGHIPAAALGAIGGVEAISGSAHQWIDSIDTSGIPHLAQPAFSDVSGVVGPAQLPTPTTSTLGGVKANNTAAHQWLTQIDATGAPQLSQPAFTDISGQITTAQLPASGISGTVTLAALTGGGTQGSITYVNGIITAVVNPT